MNIPTVFLIFFSAIGAMLCFETLNSAVRAQEGSEAKESPKKMKSYSFGFTVGNRICNDLDLFDLDELVQGLRDGALRRDARYKADERREALAKISEDLQKRRAERNRKKGEAFLKENATKEGVKVLESGLQYKIVRPGTGRKPAPTDTVEVHYRGTFIDGGEFDSSYKRGKPATFPLNRVISGWTEGVGLMKVGAKYMLYVPGHLAYGARGYGTKIGPNTTLIFEVELLSIK
jgi:FKBP-type peptidyl-prolyl cis-trans isomerase